MERIQRHGLLSTSALLDLCEVSGQTRAAIESCRRRCAVPVSHPVHGRFLINDQSPLHEPALERCLVGMSAREWYESLNRRIFFWPTWQRLEKHLAARLGRLQQRIVLTLDTRLFLEHLDDRVELCPINSGNTMRRAASRGAGTFLPPDQFPFEERKKSAGVQNAVAEVTYPYAIAPEILAALILETRVLPAINASSAGTRRRGLPK